MSVATNLKRIDSLVGELRLQRTRGAAAVVLDELAVAVASLADAVRAEDAKGKASAEEGEPGRPVDVVKRTWAVDLEIHQDGQEFVVQQLHEIRQANDSLFTATTASEADAALNRGMTAVNILESWLFTKRSAASGRLKRAG